MALTERPLGLSPMPPSAPGPAADAGPLEPMLMLKRRRKPWQTALALIVVLGTFYFMGRALYHNWSGLKEYLATLHFRWLLLPIPFLLYGVSFLVTVYAWQRILLHFGDRTSFRQAIRIIAYSMLGRYVPGKVWVVLGRVYLAREAGIAERHAALSVIIETSFQLITALALFVFSVIFYPGLLARTWLILILVPVTVVLVYPPVFNRLVNFLLLRLRQKPVDFRISFGQALVLFLLYLGAWLAQGFGLFCLALSFYPVKLSALLVFPGAFSLSWIIGFIVVFAPGGLGVREGLFAILLEPIVPGVLNIVVSLLSRIWVTVSELIIFLVVLATDGFRRKGVQERQREERT